MTLNLLCAGAAQGLVESLRARWREAGGGEIAGRFGAVGAMKEALFAGQACDVFVSTDKMIGELVDAGRLRVEGRTPLGRVDTGIAVRRGAPRPDVSSPEALTAALRAADAIYFPDAVRSTAGIHFANVLRELGIHDELAPRFRTHANGAAAMRALAEDGEPHTHSIGCTQVSEILFTEGVDLVAPLPKRFVLATTYTAAVGASAADPEQAQRLIELLAGADTLPMREAAGFQSPLPLGEG